MYIKNGLKGLPFADRIVYKRKKRRRPNFPGGHPPSIIGAKELNYCVRDGNRWILLAIVTANG